MNADLTPEEMGFSFVFICGHLRKSAAKIRALPCCGREPAIAFQASTKPALALVLPVFVPKGW
jgi:hypothetical protein